MGSSQVITTFAGRIGFALPIPLSSPYVCFVFLFYFPFFVLVFLRDEHNASPNHHHRHCKGTFLFLLLIDRELPCFFLPPFPLPRSASGRISINHPILGFWFLGFRFSAHFVYHGHPAPASPRVCLCYVCLA